MAIIGANGRSPLLINPMPAKPNESHFEETTIERLKLLGYDHADGGERTGLKTCPYVKKMRFYVYNF